MAFRKELNYYLMQNQCVCVCEYCIPGILDADKRR